MMVKAMVTLVRKIFIKAPPEIVFKVLTDFEGMPKIDPGIVDVKIISDKKEGVGVRTHWIAQTPDGGTVKWIEEITEWVPNKKYSFKAITGPMQIAGTHTLVPVEGGTEVTFEESYYHEDVNVEEAGKTMEKLLENAKNAAEKLYSEMKK